MQNPIEILATLICDDIRKEVTNKEILIGVYAGDIVLPAVPVWLPMAIWMEAEAKEAGTHELVFRLTVVNQEPPLQITAKVVVEKPSTMSFAIPGLQLQFDKVGTLSLELQQGKSWKLLKRKNVIVGDVAQFSPIVALPSDASKSMRND